MSHEGYADPVTNDGPGFRSITPVSELTKLVFEPERSGQATKLCPSGCEEPDGVTHTTHIDPHEGPTGLVAQDKHQGQQPRTRQIHDSDLPGPTARTDARIREHRLVRSLTN